MSSNQDYISCLQEAAQFIEANDDFLVVSHVQPDGDAAGSTFAMAWMLQQLGKQYTLINEGPMPPKFMFMAGHHAIINMTDVAPLRKFSRVIAVDCADYQRMGRVSESFSEDVQLLNIDHHATNNGYGRVNVIAAEAAATVEVLYDLCQTLKLELTSELSECIYSGLLTDTGGFRYANTSPKVMRIAADLLAIGVPGHDIASKLLETMTPAQVTLLQRSLSRLSFAAGGRIAWMEVTAEDIAVTSASSEDMDGLVNYARNVEGVEIGLLFKEKEEGVIKVSMRSGGSADVSVLASSFGGGGHIRASGCTVNAPLPEAVQRVVREAEAALR